MTDTARSSATATETPTDYEKTLRLQASPAALFDALTTVTGLAAWWTPVTGSGEGGGELRFAFDPPEPCVVHVDEATPTSVRWTVTECAFLPDWVGTRPTFAIVPLEGGLTELRFRHQGLTSALDCIEDCTRGWDHFLVSLGRYVESGRGMPRGGDADQARRR